MEKLEIKEFMKQAERSTVIDARSPAEFLKGHVPGAQNIPLFDNKERAEVGTLYKQESKKVAMMRGLNIAGAKLEEYVKQAEAALDGEMLLLYCWRGGMRSGSLAWLFETYGIKTGILIGGYKAFRREVLDSFLEESKIVVVGGKTGSGKTKVLKELACLGEQVIDLEGEANHKGSVFGAIGEEQQPTTEHFQNSVYMLWRSFDKLRPIYLEDESVSVGNVYLPENLMKKMKSAPMIQIDIGRGERVKLLSSDYGDASKKELSGCVLRIKERLGGLTTKNCIASIGRGEIAEACEMLLDYYDKMYSYNIEKRNTIDIISTGDAIFDAVNIAEKIKECGDSYCK